jgi:hypothetical protein
MARAPRGGSSIPSVVNLLVTAIAAATIAVIVFLILAQAL